MGKYVLKSLLQIIPVLFIVSLIVFILVRVTGDPVALMLPETATAEDRAVLTQALGLDQPLYTQYVKFLGSAIQGDFGQSFRYNQPALELVLERLPASFELAVAAMFLLYLWLCHLVSFQLSNAIRLPISSFLEYPSLVRPCQTSGWGSCSSSCSPSCWVYCRYPVAEDCHI